MAASIDDSSRALLQDRNFCHVTTLSSDGTPHTAVVWVDVEGDEILLNSSEGRTWPENLRRDPHLRLTVVNLQNPYQYLSVKGRATEVTAEGADEHIDALAKKYLDKDKYPFRQPGEVRLKIRVDPETVKILGG